MNDNSQQVILHSKRGYSAKLPRVLATVLYPPNPGARSELYITEAFIREYLAIPRSFVIKFQVASAHQRSLEICRKVFDSYPELEYDLLHLQSPYVGRRAEEISHCKKLLIESLVQEPFDYLLFLDADVWTSIASIPAWIAAIGADTQNKYVKIKYSLRDALVSPVHTLGAYFHHRDLLVRTNYAEVLFVLKQDGTRKGAPDCNLHRHLKASNCVRILPSDMLSYHFLDGSQANKFANDLCRIERNAKVRIESYLQNLENTSATQAEKR